MRYRVSKKYQGIAVVSYKIDTCAKRLLQAAVRAYLLINLIDLMVGPVLERHDHYILAVEFQIENNLVAGALTLTMFLRWYLTTTEERLMEMWLILYGILGCG